MTTTAPRFSADSFTPATQQRRRGLKLLIYGAPGVGKTTLAAGGPAPLVIDLDRGADSLADRPDVFLWRPRTWDDLRELRDWLATGQHSFETVVLDSLTEAYRMALHLAQATDGSAAPQLQHHGAATERLVSLVRAYGTLADGGLHVVFTAPETLKAEAGEDRDKLIRRPALPPRAWEGVAAAVSSIVRLTPTATGRRLTLRSRSALVAAKFRAPASVDVPETLDNPTLDHLLTLLGKGATL